MKLLLLFLALCLLGGGGGAAGALIGNAIGTGGVFVGAMVGGVAAVIGVVHLAAALGWIRPEQRFWTIVGGLLGLTAAAVVTVVTMRWPGGPAASTTLIGMGGTLGTAIGRSAHVRLDA